MSRDTPAILAPPVLLWGLCLLAAWLAERWHPVALSLGLAYGTRLALGGMGWLAAFGLGAAALRSMGRRRTPAEPWKATTAIVVSGPFRLSRNPIYVALVLSLAATALALGSPWYLGAAALLFALLDLGVVRAEERYLAARFGAPYLAYRARVRRWL